MAFNTNITVGAPPLLWSDVHDAFTKINENFDILVATVGNGSGLTPINFESLDTHLKPTVDNLYDIGDIAHKWRGVYAGEHTVADPLNGLWAGSAQIKGVGLTVNLPADSTIGGDPITGVGTSLIIDPEKTFFKEIQVDNNLSVVATTFGDTLNLLSGSGINLTVSSGADSIEIDNTGILSVIAGSGMSVSTVNGDATITNAGVRSLQSTTSLPSGRTTGAGINISGSTGDNLRITNTGILSVSSGVGITVSLDSATGDVTITNSAPAVNAFAQIQVNGDGFDRILADATSDILNINSGEGITLTKNTTTDTLTISVNPVFDLRGSVFGDDSSIIIDGLTNRVFASNGFFGNLTGNVTGDVKGSVFGDDSSTLVDAVSNYIYGNVSATTLRTAESQIALGSDAGKTSQSTYAVAIGQEAGKTSQGSSAVSIGYLSGGASQGNQAISIGYQAGTNTQGQSGVAIGFEAGKTSQGTYGISIGHLAGEISQGSQSIAIGPIAGGSSQGSNAIAMGYQAGTTTQGTGAVALGYTAAQVTQGSSAVAIGWSAGQTNQGAYSIAIGYRAGFTNQNASSIVLNASGAALEAAAAGFFVNPIRSSANGRPLMYDTATSELVSSNVLEFIGSTISTSDSSGLTIDVQTTFNSDLRVENDLTVLQNITLQGSRVININELKSLVAASSSFSDFQTRIASLV